METKVTVKESKLNELIKQLRKYNFTREIDSYTVALYMADDVFPIHISTNMCSMIQYVLQRNDTYDAVYRLMHICNIEVIDDIDDIDFTIEVE
jgi:hypothetical protein